VDGGAPPPPPPPLGVSPAFLRHFLKAHAAKLTGAPSTRTVVDTVIKPLTVSHNHAYLTWAVSHRCAAYPPLHLTPYTSTLSPLGCYATHTCTHIHTHSRSTPASAVEEH